MSSGTRPESYAGAHVAAAMGEKFLKKSPGSGPSKAANLGMGPRQLLLNWRWAWYRCLHYEARAVDWDGSKRTDPVDHEAIATSTFLPPGTYDAGESMPLKFRKPTAPYPLGKVIVDRFTGLLFSERRHPRIGVDGDPDTEDFVAGMLEASRFWSQMVMARGFGGGQGTAVAMYGFTDGVPMVEVFDPRWCFPTWRDRKKFVLRALEIRFIFHDQRRDPETGGWVEVPLWSRRVIDDVNDTVWEPVEVGDGQEPDWDDQAKCPSTVVAHGLGECPVRWCQNLPCLDSIDGDPDCHGVYDMMETMDGELAQAHKSLQYAGDPTPVYITDANLQGIKMGSGNAMKLPAGSSAHFLETSGEGIKAATELAMKWRDLILEVAECVLEHQDKSVSVAKTATEVERDYSAMIGKADKLRESYGEGLVKPLITGMLRAAIKFSQAVPEVDAAGVTQMVRRTIQLPPKVTPGKDGNPGQVAPRILGKSTANGAVPTLSSKWPGYFEPGLADANLATSAVTRAIAGKVLDQEHAAQFVAPFFRVEDVPAMLKKIKDEAAQDQAALEAMALQGGGGFRGAGGGGAGGGGGGGGSVGGIGEGGD